MLPVGREINIHKKDLVCRHCDWEGVGTELSAGLLRITGGDIYLYAYRCPECGSFDVTAKGKLLEFRSHIESITHESDRRGEDMIWRNTRAQRRTKIGHEGANS